MTTWNTKTRTKKYDTMSEEFETIKDVPVNSELINALEEAGASSLLIELVELNPDNLPEGIERNSCRQEVQKYCYWGNEVSAEVIKDKQNYGGHFFQACWDGDVSGALGRADLNNQRIMEQLGYGDAMRVV